MARAKATPQKAPAKATVVSTDDKTIAATSVDANNAADPTQDAKDQSSQSEANSVIENSADAKPDDGKLEDDTSVDIVMIRTKRGVQQFRRAGFTFTREARPIDISALSLDQVKALAEEPRLEVVEASFDIEPAQ